MAPEIHTAAINCAVPSHKETITADIWAIGLIIVFCIAERPLTLRMSLD